MWYIVYRTPFKSYTNTGGGYYVGYKNKLEDKYSDNYVEAKKYKSIPSIISRLGISIPNQICSIDDFIKWNTKSKETKRDIKINKVLGEDNDLLTCISERGRVEKLDKNGKLVGDATEDLIRYIQGKIDKNSKSRSDLIKRLENCDVGSYILKEENDDAFWEEFKKG